MNSETFIKIARISGILVAILFFYFVWTNLAWLAVLVFVLWFSSMYLLKSSVEEPLIDERTRRIQEMAMTRTGQAFAITLMITILILATTGERKILATLEITLALFLVLKLAFTKYYEVKM